MTHTRKATTGRAASAATLLLLLAGCAGAPRHAAEVDLEPMYVFSGVVGGEAIDGSIAFRDDGGYILESSHGICDRPGRRLSRSIPRQAATGTIRLTCEALSLELRVVDGTLEERSARAVLSRSEQRTRRGGCAQVDPDTGSCIRWHWITDTVRFPSDGTVELRVP